MGAYERIRQASVDDPETFWLDAAGAIDWTTTPTRALDGSAAPFYRWFPDGELNVCANALDRHIDAGRGDQAALIYDSPVTGTVDTYTYRELRDQVARFAGVLARRGVGQGDRVVVYLPMIPQAAIAMLACARLGAIHSVVFGGFAPRELAARIDDATPKVIVSASCGIEVQRVIEYKPLLDRAIEIAAHKPETCVVLQRPQAIAAMGPRDVDWDAAMAAADPVDPVPVKATDPLYILYTSGTTGKPKGVVRDGGGYSVALAWTMKWLYDVGPGEVMFTASDVGWVVGHSYIVYGPLLAGATTVLYEGKPVGTPDAGQFWRVVADYRVKSLFTAPTAFRAIRKADPTGELVGRYDVSSLKYLFLAGGAAGSGDLPVGLRVAGHPGHRSLVADRNRLGDRREPGGHRAPADQGGLADPADAGLGRADPGSLGFGHAGRGGRGDRDQAAVAAGITAHPLE